MFSGAVPCEENLNCDSKMMEQQKPETYIIDMCIPKVEPYYPSTSDSNEDSSSFDGIINSPIPFTAPYKVKDPIVLLERCDKIWETLKLIKNVQNTNCNSVIYNTRIEEQPVEMSNTPNASVSDAAEFGSTYIKYQPVLGNNNSALPNFTFSVKTTKKLFHCSICGKQYIENRSLRHHSEKIHGIYIPPKRPRKSNGKVDDKKLEIAEKDQDSNETYSMKNSVQDQTEDYQAVMHRVKENERNNTIVQPQKRRKSSRTSDQTNIDTLQTGPKSKLQCTEVQESQRKSVAHSDSVLCVLCKRLVKDIKRHLTDYHKIGCADIMLKELGKSSQTETPITPNIKDVKKTVPNTNESLQRKSDVATREKHLSLELKNGLVQNFKEKETQNIDLPYTDPTKKHTLNNNNISCNKNITKSLQPSALQKTDAYQCDICFGAYASVNGLNKHKRIHRRRGETKENFHLFKCRYHKSPLCLKSRTTLSSVNSATASPLMFDNVSGTKGMSEQVSTDPDYIQEGDFNDNNDEQLETTCNCGRSFRNPHTLFIHKANCKLQTDEEKLLAIDNALGRDAGNGISITIKKKNDSYEIVGKESVKEDASTDLSHNEKSDKWSKLSNYFAENYIVNQTKNQPLQPLNSSKYSKDHSILKLQFVDEDIDVDVEDDSRNKIYNNNKNGTFTNQLQSKSCKEMAIARKEQNVQQQKVPDLKYLCEQVLAKYKWRNSLKTSNCVEPSNITCICGKVFHTKRALNVHAAKTHQPLLACGYCNEKFTNVNEYHNHQCTVYIGKDFVEPSLDIHCHYCNDILDSKKKFNEHIEFKHPDPAEPYSCYICPKRFPTNVLRQVHWGKKHSVYYCSICNKKCRTNLKIKHDGYHSGLGFPCHICKKAYPSRRFIGKHINTVHRKWKDDISYANYSKKLRRPPVEEVANTSTNESCKLCGKVLYNSRSLKRHVMTVHHGIYKLECNSCNVFFMSKRALDIHKEKGTCKKSSKTPMEKGIMPGS